MTSRPRAAFARGGLATALAGLVEASLAVPAGDLRLEERLDGLERSASPGVLSSRMRTMRGKRSAKPLACRSERWMPSNATSRTISGRTSAHAAASLER